MAVNGNIYAFLVGIDTYPGSIPQLRGCVNDIKAFETYLKERIDTQHYPVHLHKLLNQSATRQAVIDGFTEHLCRAGSNDVALFYYSGHGSQEPAPPEFWHLEPDRLNETLVCWDSRQPGGWDLADKELAYLIAQVDKQHPHIVLILDCCHSGSGTRDVRQLLEVRHAPTIVQRIRTMNDFLFTEAALNMVFRPPSARKDKTQSGWNLPQGNHILLAGCQDREVASEYPGDGQYRGAFSYFLLDTLQKTHGHLTYRELFKRASALVRSRIKEQSPQLEATSEASLDLPFLGDGDAIANRPPYFTLSYDNQHGWVIDGGAVHGLPSTTSEPIPLALYPQGATAKQMRKLDQAVGQANIIDVLPHLSVVHITQGSEQLTTDTVLNAVVISLPLPPIGVLLDGEEEALDRIQQALAIGGLGRGSLYVRRVDHLINAQLRVLARNNEYLITKPTNDKPLVEQITGYSQPNATKVVKRLEHIARWLTVAQLSSSVNSRIPEDAISMHIYQEGTETKATQLRLTYQSVNGKWQSPRFQLQLKNNSDQRLYCALLDLTERYSISVPAELLPGNGIWLDPGAETWAHAQKPIHTSIPKELIQQGITEYQDILKLIVSTAEFDATLLSQDKLDRPKPQPKRAIGIRHRGTLNCLMNRVTAREIRGKEAEDIDEWITSQIAITTVRPQDTTPVQAEGS